MAGANEVSFAEALSFLYDRCKRENGKPYSDRDVAQVLKEAGAADSSHSYLWMLRNGKKTDPRASVIGALARFFGVPAGFFLDPAVHAEWTDRIDRRTRPPEVPAQRQGQGQAVLLRAGLPGISDQARTLIEALAEHVSELEHKGFKH
ncbi:hypothetical protein G3I59_36835 [Amycolatopsis rubida]|uniref:HTH cro/C1-type domain-containing protein n=1 Tax=Amycolatopsis rubida TaxID=112413 RepID=A0ABX0C389_9PSEU|nr:MULTISPECIES: hypothetical protein [Amycolatopsis]MYW96026.1 hypothetical protein [Amycolatopsis rubida]NEC61017.1 hypothetical protein [Amycolatopsis rubida]OAP20545.1 Nucleoid-associated protein EspR [Amycolatopsis sp. M39]